MAVEEEPRRGLPAFAVVGPAILAGALLMFGLLQLRPDRGPAPRDPAGLAALFAEPSGYTRLADAEAGTGPVPIQAAGRKMAFAEPLHSGDLESAGFVAAHDRAWGRPGQSPPRGVIVLLAEYEDAEGAATVHALLRTRQRPSLFPVSGPPGAFGFVDRPDPQGRHYRRVVFAKDRLVVVVSVLTPARDADAAEIQRIARAQYDAM